MSPKTKEQFEQIRLRSAASILQAALELFAHKGFAATSISAIAKEAGVSKGLIYNYYPSKEALLEAIVMGAMQEGDDLINETLTPQTPPEEQLQHLIESAMNMIRSNFHYWKLLTSLAFQPDVLNQFEPMIKEKGRQSIEMIEHLFVAMGKENPKKEALLLGAYMDGMALHYMSMKDDYPFDDMMAFAIEKFCK